MRRFVRSSAFLFAGGLFLIVYGVVARHIAFGAWAIGIGAWFVFEGIRECEMRRRGVNH